MHPARILFCLSFFALAVSVSAQTPAPPAAPAAPQTTPLPTDPAALLQFAARVNGLHGADLHPWHLHATWQTLDGKKRGKAQGTWEEWWAGEKSYRIVVTSGDGQLTVYDTDHGRFFLRAPGKGPDTELPPEPGTVPAAYFSLVPGELMGAEFILERLLTHPVPEITADSLHHMRLQETQREEGAVSLTCALQALILPDGNPHVTLDKNGRPQPSINRYCFDHGAPVLRMESSPGQVTLFNTLVRFQNQYLARSIRIESTGVWTSTTHSHDPAFSQQSAGYSRVQTTDVNIDIVELLTSVKGLDLDPPAGAIPLSGATEDAVALGVTAGSRIAGKDLDLSQAVEWQNQLDGKVVIAAKILKDGSVGDLRVISGPRDLRQIFLDTVRTYRFEPYLVGGEPVEVGVEFDLNLHRNF